MATVKIKTPVGELMWISITGEGKEDLQGRPKYLANVVVSKDEAAVLQKQMMTYWQENRPKTVKEPKSTGWYPHMIRTDDIDPDTEKNIYKEDPEGRVEFRFKTNTVWPKDNKPVIVNVLNSKGAKVNLGDKQIGNGSIGRIIGSFDLYKVATPKGQVTDAGLTLYLSSVQLAKLVEFSAEEEVDEIAGYEDDGLSMLDVQEAPLEGPSV